MKAGPVFVGWQSAWAVLAVASPGYLTIPEHTHVPSQEIPAEAWHPAKGALSMDY